MEYAERESLAEDMTIWKIGAAQIEVTEGQIRGYSIVKREDSLTFDQLQIIAMDYLNKVLRKLPKFDKWPKDIKDLCASKGIIQDKQTGLPIYDDHIGLAWSIRARRAEAKLRSVQEALLEAELKIEGLEHSKRVNRWP